MTIRKIDRDSIRFKAEQVNGLWFTVYIVDDLYNHTLQQHFERAWHRRDYEYMDALATEATVRGIKLKLPEE